MNIQLNIFLLKINREHLFQEFKEAQILIRSVVPSDLANLKNLTIKFDRL